MSQKIDLSILSQREVIVFVTSKSEITTLQMSIDFDWGYHRSFKVVKWLESLKIIKPIDNRSFKVLVSEKEAIEILVSEPEDNTVDFLSPKYLDQRTPRQMFSEKMFSMSVELQALMNDDYNKLDEELFKEIVDLKKTTYELFKKFREKQ